jgi:hypothetical protein
MKIIELVLDETQSLNGIEAISIVEYPAIEENFVALNSQDRVQFAAQDAEKRILMGAALIPNKPIYRNQDGEEFYVYFTSKTIRQAAELFLMRGNQNESTLEHEAKLTGLSVVESWIIEDEQHDKSRKYGMDLPVGTWMVSMKVNNDQVWNDFVKTGKVKGFSIEGYFVDKVNMMSHAEQKALATLVKINDIVKVYQVEMESFSDYPKAVSNNAKRGIALNEKNGNKCATQVGKVRAQQLANGEPVSLKTIKRMYSYLSRAEEYYDEGDTSACGTISYLLWGGKAAKRWSEAKLRALDQIK